MKQWVAAIFILSICSSMAFADDWEEIKKNKGIAYSIYTNKIKTKDGNKKIFWVKTEYKMPQKAPNKKLYSEAKTRMTIDCSEETIIEMELFTYNKNGDSVYVETEWDTKRAIIPGSIGDALKEYVCE